MAKLSTKHSTVTTYRLSFCDSKRFLGEAIFDMDDSAGVKTISELTKEATRLGINNLAAKLWLMNSRPTLSPKGTRGN